MVMMAQPIMDAMAEAAAAAPGARRIYLGPRGRKLTTDVARELASESSLILLCGHYEGVDERVIEEAVDEEISVGDYVLTGGELPALILADSISRMLPGVLPNEEAFTFESHYSALLEHPQYTRPFVWRERQVPEVLISGHHANIEKWKREQSLTRTLERRPDLLEKAELTDSDREYIKKQKNSCNL